MPERTLDEGTARHDRLAAQGRAHLWHPAAPAGGSGEPLPGEEPLVLDHATGCWLFDTQGRKYLDGVSSLGANLHGHRKVELDSAIKLQLSHLAHRGLAGQASPPAIELAAELCRQAPRFAGQPTLERVVFAESASGAVEEALKIALLWQRARGHPRKHKFVALGGAFHGETLGALSVGGVDPLREQFGPLLFEVLRVPAPHAFRWPTGPRHCLEAAAQAAEALIHGRHGELAALVIEPLVQVSAGVITHPPGYLRRLAKACREREVLLICDEAATSPGRSGTLFACEQEEVVPDLLCLGEALSGGVLPLAATLAAGPVEAAFRGEGQGPRVQLHGLRQDASPLACAAALASLALFEAESTLQHVRDLSARLAEGLRPLAAHPHVGDLRQRGLIAGVELLREKAGKEEYRPEERIGARVCLAARRRQLLIRPLGDVLALVPPLAVSAQEIDLLVEAVEASIREVCG